MMDFLWGVCENAWRCNPDTIGIELAFIAFVLIGVPILYFIGYKLFGGDDDE